MQTVGVFKNPNTMDCIVGQLQEAGLDRNALSLVVRDREEPGETKPGDAVGPATVATAAKGGLIGVLAGLVVGVGTVLVPGVGPIIVGGPAATILGALVATLSGAAAGATIGVLAGLIGNIGVPERQAHEYALLISQGEGLVMFEHEGGADVEGIFRRCGCRNVRSYTQ